MWGRSSVWEILHNPKYTGFMCGTDASESAEERSIHPRSGCGRRSPRTRRWVSREVFDKANLTAIKHDNVTKAKDGHQANPKHTYVLRSFLRCGLCGLQTHGNVKKRPQRRLLHVRDQPPAPRSWSDIARRSRRRNGDSAA